MVAMALQQDGWYLRADCVWSKRNPLPSSVKDRPALSHEYVFLLTKAKRYYYDHIAVREPARYGPRIHAPSNGRKYHEGDAPKNPHSLYFAKTSHAPDPGAGRNLRTVWSLATEPLSGKRFGAEVEHFAAFSQKLVEPCVLASTSAYGCCSAKIKKLRMRSDLTPEERQKIEAFLARKGML
jgi:site-specific DNA-methyltransferase (cytosine-N4-specific)